MQTAGLFVIVTRFKIRLHAIEATGLGREKTKGIVVRATDRAALNKCINFLLGQSQGQDFFMPYAAATINHRPLMQAMAGKIRRTIARRLKQAADPCKSLLFLLWHQRRIRIQQTIFLSIAAT